MKGYLICGLLLCLSLSVCGQSPVAYSQQNMNLLRRIMAARLALRQQPNRVVQPIVMPRRYPPMGNNNFWNTALMAGMLNDDGMLFFD